MKKVALCIIMVVAFTAMVCGASYAEAGKCVSCGSPCVQGDRCPPCQKYVKCIGECFTFDASKSTAFSCGPCPATLTYAWDFGDGTTAEGPIVTKVYEKTGQYTVKLTITDGSNLGACNTDAITQVVTVNAPPTAIFTGPDCACVDQEVTFDASKSSSPTAKTLNYHWSFSDGTTAEGVIVKHTFTSGGRHNVTLTVDDGSCSACCTDVASLCVMVNSSPCAEAGNDVCMTCVPACTPLDVSFRGAGTNPDGGGLTYMWNFGDGTSAEGQNVTHTFPGPGTYKVALIVNNGCNSACSTASDTLTVTISVQPCAEAGVDHFMCVNTAAEFDGTKSTAGSGAVYEWDFGDGEKATGAKVSHAYAKSGQYQVHLTVTDGECVACDTACVRVNDGPTAAICGPDQACTGDNISFNASGSTDPDGDCLTYNWDFGDGTKIENGGPQVCHVFQKGGVYTVTVTVNDGSGLVCSTSAATAKVTINGRPTAIIGPCDACCVGKEILWDSTGSSDPDGDPLTYSWDFGDGTTADGAKPTHTYKAAGNYNVTLKVDDGKGTVCSVAYASYVACIHDSPKADLCVD